MEHQALDMCGLGDAIGRGELDPVDLVQDYFARIAAHPLSDRIYARLMQDRAIKEANAANERAKLGTRRGRLDGVPISWKDLFDTKDVGTEAGSKLLKGRVPNADAEMVRRGSLAGLIPLGKTHMSELAFSGLGLNPMTETTPCVNDLTAVSGGSSSGAAGSVAFDLAPGAIGSDTGGSVRIPAAWNDVVGFKTTAGRLPLCGVVPLAQSFDTVGVLAKSVRDAAEVFAILDGTPVPDLRNETLQNNALQGTRFLVLDNVVFDDIREAPLAGFNGAVERLKSSGARIERASIPAVEAAMELSAILFTTQAYGAWKELIEANPDLMFPPILERFRAGKNISNADYLAAWSLLEKLRKQYLQATAIYDAVILPAAPILPPNTARLLSDPEYYVQENLLALRNTRVGNLMGLAAITLPTGVASTGIILQTPPNSEHKLLRLAVASEAALA